MFKAFVSLSPTVGLSEFLQYVKAYLCGDLVAINTTWQTLMFSYK
jgi:hypothetical protein